jgi:2-polyprenyl-3-methyl-5-hydroxy-6-metoxy-1,4-benzoquinol methylase
LVITNARPTAESLGYFYPSNYNSYDPQNSGRSTWWSKLLERSALRCHYGYPSQPVGIVTRALAQLAQRKFRSRRKRHEWFPYRGAGDLLDVGCGGGRFLERMREFGWNVTGIDLAADVARRVEQRTGIRVHAGTLPHPDLKPQSFDAVTLWHVLEHVPDPRGLLNCAADLLRPNGLLVIEVPNIASWSFAEFGANWAALELPRHLQHFDPETLSAMLPAGRFRNVELQQIGSRSLIKLSAERAFAQGDRKYSDWLKQGKAIWSQQADRTESANQGDLIRLVAERI